MSALVWSAGLLLAALLWPAYSTSATSPEGVTLGHATLVEVNGLRALILTAIPALVSAVVLWAIRARRSGARWSGARWAGPVAWAAIGVLAVETLLGIMTIGLFILPALILLAIAMRHASSAAGRAHDVGGGLATGT